jgi:hypothetical protein
MSGDVSTTAGVLIAGEGIGNAGSTSDLVNTLAWGGVLDVSDSLGDPVSEFSLVGLGSGYDFREAVAVPEPNKLMLQLAATAAIALCRRIARQPARTPYTRI